MRLDGKTAVVTGAGSGFGSEIAKRFVAEGAKVVVADINEDNAAHVAKELGDATIHIKADVGQSADSRAMIEIAYKTFGSVDILVNNAGYSNRNCSMLDLDEATFDRIFDVNVKSIYLAAKTAVPIMRQQGTGGCILNVASISAVRPRPGLVWYAGSKGAVVTITRAMAVELARDNIRVNAINPVLSETGLAETFIGTKVTDENRSALADNIPLGRLGRPTDMAAAALFLVSDEAEFITGVALDVDGGRAI